ncbi:MAG: 4Fe-4S dicluster domain-containing protein, partial [Candidatus Subteraquimicrobiales bacterium]|nr:4Fe-4S dicluster domain-containing protein [Candidatus Subteraquimicrobiales bacterium]
KIRHGVTILATGATEYRGEDYLLGEDPRVLTLLDLERKISENLDELKRLKDIVFIQCVGPVGKKWYCSRICCTTAIKNALKIKEINPEANVFILYKDVRTYGFKEKYYTQAREKGIIFIRCSEANQPSLAVKDGDLWIKVKEPSLNQDLLISPDLLVLTTALVPSEGAEELASLLKVPQSEEGFFLEAHVKLRPVDICVDGIFLCGMAHYPKFIDESIVQALAVAGRAATVLSKKKLEVGGVIAAVEEDGCAVCLTCLRVCPYGAPFINEKGVAQIEVAKCQGCGICAAECPAKVIQLLHYRDEEIMVEVDALFAEAKK